MNRRIGKLFVAGFLLGGVCGVLLVCTQRAGGRFRDSFPGVFTSKPVQQDWEPGRANHQQAAMVAPCDPVQSNNPMHSDEALNERALGRLYPSAIALRVLKDVRIMLALSTNDVPSARRLLILDLDGSVSTLSNLCQDIELSEFDAGALQQGQQFMEENANHNLSTNVGQLKLLILRPSRRGRRHLRLHPWPEQAHEMFLQELPTALRRRDSVEEVEKKWKDGAGRHLGYDGSSSAWCREMTNYDFRGRFRMSIRFKTGTLYDENSARNSYW